MCLNDRVHVIWAMLSFQDLAALLPRLALALLVHSLVCSLVGVLQSHGVVILVDAAEAVLSSPASLGLTAAAASGK
jgi:hypothetical protein